MATNLNLLDEAERKSPLVSVVIPSFNYGRFLEEAVDSVLGQTLADVEIIVVEGGSTDSTSRQVAEALSRPRTRVIFQDRPTRVGANRNRGIAEARGTYIVCLDADDRLSPTYLEKAIFILEFMGYDVVSSAMKFFGRRDDVINILQAPDLQVLLNGNHVLTCAAFRKSLWAAAGGYVDCKNSRGHVHEDWAFWIRLAAQGARFRNMPFDPLLFYRAHGPSLSNGDDVLPMDEQRHAVWDLAGRSIGLREVETSTWMSQKIIRRKMALPALRCVGNQNDDTQRTILLAMPFLVLGGAEKLLSSLVGELSQQGWRVVICTSVMPTEEMGDTTSWFNPFVDEIFHLPRFLHESEWPAFFDYLIASRKINLLWIVGSAFAYGQLRQIMRRHQHLKVVDLLFNNVGHVQNNQRWRRYIDKIIVENSNLRDWLIRRGESEARIEVITSGVDVDRLKPSGRDPVVMSALPDPKPDVIIGFVGRWSDEKNPLAFIEIMRRVGRPECCASIMTGAGPLKRRIEEAIRRSNFHPGRFVLAENVEKIEPWLSSMDLLVLPSLVDGRPVAVLEALALGVPVLASRVGALPELIEDGDNGWLCDPSDIDAFVAKIEQFIGDADRRTVMGRRARAFAERHLDQLSMFRNYHRVFAETIEGKSPSMDG